MEMNRNEAERIIAKQRGALRSREEQVEEKRKRWSNKE